MILIEQTIGVDLGAFLSFYLVGRKYPDPVLFAFQSATGLYDCTINSKVRKTLTDMTVYFDTHAVPGKVLAANKYHHRHCSQGNCFHDDHGHKGMLQ